MDKCRDFAEWCLSPEFGALLMGAGAKALIQARARDALQKDMPGNLRIYPERRLEPGPIAFKPGCV